MFVVGAALEQRGLATCNCNCSCWLLFHFTRWVFSVPFLVSGWVGARGFCFGRCRLPAFRHGFEFLAPVLGTKTTLETRPAPDGISSAGAARGKHCWNARCKLAFVFANCAQFLRRAARTPQSATATKPCYDAERCWASVGDRKRSWVQGRLGRAFTTNPHGVEVCLCGWFHL